MVTVPTYQRDTSTRPIFQQDLAAQATPQAFGADIGRGLQSLARGMDQASIAMAQVQDLEDTTRAKEADNAYASWLRESMYGEKGFMTLEGRNAIDARKAFEEEADKKRAEFSKDLNPQAARKYDGASQQRLQTVYQQSIVHTANERKTWFKETSAARVSTFADDALANFSNPKLVTKNIAGGILEIREAGALQGWDEDTLKLRESEFISGVHKNIALRIAQSDPLAAVDYMKAHDKQLTGEHKYDLNSALESGIIEEEAKRETQALSQKTRKVADLPGDIVGEVAGVEPSDKPIAGKKLGDGGPTVVRSFLMGKTTKGADHIDGLDASFATNLAAMMQDAPPDVREGLQIMSGYRSVERQRQLWEKSDKSGKMVAPPGRSYHNHGQAVDLTWNGQRLDKAPENVRSWVHENASKYGMYFPMSYEPWHIEPQGTRDGTIAAKTNNVVPRATMPSYDDIEAHIAGIKNPKVADLVRRRFNAQIEAQNKAVEMREKTAKAELWRVIDAGGTPDQVPQDIRQDAGLSAVNSAWEYMDKAAKRQEIVSDETLLYDMRRYAAMEPEKFADLDLNDYRDRLSKDVIKELTGLQTGALTDQRKAKEDGLNLTTAFSQAETQLEAVGLTTAGKDGSEREEAARRIAQFQNMLAEQMADFKKTSGKAPNQMEIQGMVNKLLLPVVIKTEKSIWNPTKTPWSAFNENEGLAFELGGIGTMADGTVVEPSVKYKDIPPRDRVEIEVALETQLGRKPSEAEVEGAYRRFLAEAK